MDPTQGNGAPQASQGEGDSPKYVSEEQLNRAITARFKTFEKSFESKFSEFGSSMFAKFEEFMKQAPAQPQQSAQPQSAQPEESQEMKRMKKSLDELKASLEAERQEKMVERSKNKQVVLRQKLAEELAKNGVNDPVRAKLAIGNLVDAEKRVKISDSDDSISFVDFDNVEVDLAAGIRSWIKSEEAKIFLPAKNVTGSGSRPGGTNSPIQQQQGRMSKEELGHALYEKLMNGEL